MKKISLELGGKNAAIIFDDANLEKCIQVVCNSKLQYLFHEINIRIWRQNSKSGGGALLISCKIVIPVS